jgi:hypothetical protein
MGYKLARRIAHGEEARLLHQCRNRAAIVVWNAIDPDAGCADRRLQSLPPLVEGVER